MDINLSVEEIELFVKKLKRGEITKGDLSVWVEKMRAASGDPVKEAQIAAGFKELINRPIVPNKKAVVQIKQN